jgi:hypothetical protein
MIREIEKRKQPRDFILTIGGTSQSEVGLAHPDLMMVEYSMATSRPSRSTGCTSRTTGAQLRTCERDGTTGAGSMP